eukprot:768460-Hanusia_phi.AAC.3
MLGRNIYGIGVWSKSIQRHLLEGLYSRHLPSNQPCAGQSRRYVHTSSAVELASFIPKRIGDIKEYTSKPITFILHGMLGRQLRFISCQIFGFNFYCRSSYNWRSFLVREDFLPGRYICALDLRNHGRSQHASSMRYDEMGEDVFGFASGLGAEKLSLIGHSMGGKVAMNMALKHPDKLSSLVVVDIAPVDYSSSSMHLSILDAMAVGPGSRDEGIHIDQLDPGSRNEAVQVEGERGSHPVSGLLRECEAPHFLASCSDGVMNGELKKFNIVILCFGFLVLISLLTGSKPVLQWTNAVCERGEIKLCAGVMTRKSAQMILTELQDIHFERIRSFFPNSRVETVENAGHWIHHEAPEELNKILNNWFEEIAPQEGTRSGTR